MESEEAIMENENNSNLESNSCSRDKGEEQTTRIICSDQILADNPEDVPAECALTTSSNSENSRKFSNSGSLSEDNIPYNDLELSSKNQREQTDNQLIDVDEEVIQDSQAKSHSDVQMDIDATEETNNLNEVAFDNELHHTELSKNSSIDVTKYMDNEIDLLSDDSHDSSNQKISSECERSSVHEASHASRGKNSISVSGAAMSSVDTMEVDDNDGAVETTMKVVEAGLTVSSNPSTPSKAGSEAADEVLKVQDETDFVVEDSFTQQCSSDNKDTENERVDLPSIESNIKSVGLSNNDHEAALPQIQTAPEDDISQEADSGLVYQQKRNSSSENAATEALDHEDSCEVLSNDGILPTVITLPEHSQATNKSADTVLRTESAETPSHATDDGTQRISPFTNNSSESSTTPMVDLPEKEFSIATDVKTELSPEAETSKSNCTEKDSSGHNELAVMSTDYGSESSSGTPVVQNSESSSGTPVVQNSESSTGTPVVQNSESPSGTPVVQNSKSKPYSDGENDQDVEILDIKKEVGDPDVVTSTPSTPAAVEQFSASVSIKKEPNTEKEDGDEDVIIIDDAGELVPIKKEVTDTPVSQNGLDIQIASVSGQQHQLHANIDQVSSTVAAAAKSKPDTSKSKAQACIVCNKICRCKYNIIRNGDMKHLCNDECFKQFRTNPTAFLKPRDDSRAKDSLLNVSTYTNTSFGSKQSAVHKTCTVCQLIDLNAPHPFFSWNGFDFCGNSCQEKFQSEMIVCFFCHSVSPRAMGSMYCTQIGNDMRSFCSMKCCTEYKEKSKLCAGCLRDLAFVPGALTAMVGTGADCRLRHFCSQACLKKRPGHSNSDTSGVEILNVAVGTQEICPCSVCEKMCQMKYSVWFQNKSHKLCSDLCMSAFQYTNKICIGKCDGCGVVSTGWDVQAQFVRYEGHVKRFCSETCISVFCKNNSRLVSCRWCNNKKLNFDMIEGLDAENKVQLFCSCNCLSLYRVSIQAKSNQAVTCNHCLKIVPAQYHLTMSDASVRNFCSYACVMTFQTQFMTKQGSTGPGSGALFTTSSPGMFQIQQEVLVRPAQQQNLSVAPSRRGRKSAQEVARQQAQAFPIISSVVSLAPQGELQVQSITPTVPGLPQLVPSPAVAAESVGGVLPSSDGRHHMGGVLPSADGRHHIVIQTEPPKTGKNKSLQCRPITQTKATSCRPHSQSKEVQTDANLSCCFVVLPVPVPVYIPMPTVMFTAPTPKFVPMPIPVPVPVFIPTTRKSVNGISRTIKEIVERIPSDPLEAELLMMAEAVAADKKPEDTDTESETGAEESDADEKLTSSEPSKDKSLRGKTLKEHEEDSMNAEVEDSVEDLEASVHLVAVSSDPPALPQPPPKRARKSIVYYDSDDDDDYVPSRPSRGRGAKRPTRGRPPSSRSKRPCIDKTYVNDDDEDDDEDARSETSVKQKSVVAPPSDANRCLKFSYGVNAWLHWVIKKNAEMEKSGTGVQRVRLFPTDILKCTTEELNISLCMFLKEVRKPGGEEYSPDSIYYLCLGIQQYLYENTRIDNIFTDAYFETFSDSLHEILKLHKPKVNSQGQMLCRIEEEHLWESKQLGAHSPFVLLTTLIYFHTKHFILKTSEDHMSLSFAQILKHWKKGTPVKGQSASTGKNVSLRFYCLTKKDGFITKKGKEGVPVYEVTENFDNPLRCPVKLYEFFLSKCPESIKSRSDIFYPVPERSCVPDSPVWYSTKSIDIELMNKILTRVLLVREIQEALVHAQPIYV